MAKTNDKKADDFRNAGKYDEYAHEARKIRKGMERPNLDKSGKRIGESTHLMVSANIDDRNVAFPTLFPHKEKPGRWIDYSDEREGTVRMAYDEARSRGEVFEFGQDEKEAKAFAKGSWKPK